MQVFRGWWQVTVYLVLNAASSACVFTAYSVVVAPFQKEFEPSRTMLSMGVTLAVLATGGLGPILGSAFDRFSLRRLMLAGTFILSFGFILLSFTTSMNQVVLIYFCVLSVGSVLCGPVAGSALVARWFSRRRGLAMSIAASGAAIGGLIVPPLLQTLIEAFDWRTALQIFGVGLFFVTAPVAAFLAIDRPSDRNLYPDGDSQPPPVSTNLAHRKVDSMTHFFRDKNFWFIGITLGLLLGGPMGLIAHLVQFAGEKGIEPTKAAVLISIFSATNFIGKLSSGPIADKVDFRIMLSVILILLSLGTFGFIQSDSYTFLVTVIAIVGVTQGGIVPLWSLILAKIYGPDNMGRSMGLMGVLIMPFTIVSPLLFGLAYDLTGTYNAALFGYIVLLICAFIPLGLIRIKPPEPAVATA